MVTQYRVIVDRDACIGCGVSAELCNKVFMLNSIDGKNQVVPKYQVEHSDSISVGIIPGELYECALSAVQSCPVEAIKLEKTS